MDSSKFSTKGLNSGDCSIRVYLLVAAELYFSILLLKLAFPGNLKDSTRFFFLFNMLKSQPQWQYI